jgi:hypothetical protein
MPRKSITEKPIVVSTGAAAAVPARRKSSSTKRGTRALEAPGMVEAVGPSHEEIARLAYSYWKLRGCTGGSPEEDWLRAEQELRSAQ